MQEAEMPARGDRLARARRLVRPVEGGDHRLEGRLSHDVLILDLASKVIAQRLNIDGHGFFFFSVTFLSAIASALRAVRTSAAARLIFVAPRRPQLPLTGRKISG